MKRFSGTDEDDSSVSMTSWLFSEKGRMACIPLCVLRSFDTATIFMALVICSVFFTLFIRVRIARILAIYAPPFFIFQKVFLKFTIHSLSFSCCSAPSFLPLSTSSRSSG